MPEVESQYIADLEASETTEEYSIHLISCDKLRDVNEWCQQRSQEPWILLGGTEADWAAEDALALGALDTWLPSDSFGRLKSRIERAGRLAVREHELNTRDGDLTDLLDLIASLTSSMDIGDILRSVVQRVTAVGNFGRASIILAPDESDPTVGFVVAASDDEKISNLQLDLKKYPEVQHVLKTGAAEFIDNVATHDLLSPVRNNTLTVGSMTLFPLRWSGDTLGVLFLRAPSAGVRLQPRQLAFCEVVSKATGIALRNARVIQSLRDRTQRMSDEKFKAEHRVRDLEQYASLFRSVAEGIAVLDLSGNLIFANPRGYEIVSATQSNVTHGRILDWVCDSSRETVATVWENIRTGTFARGVDVEILDANGRRMWCSCSFAALPEDESIVLLSFTDVTSQRETERELKRTKEFLESLIHTTVDGIIAANMEGIVVVFNEGAERLFKLPAAEVIGKLNVRDLYADDAAFEVMKRLRSDAHGGRGQLTSARFEIRDSRGAIVPISLTASLVYEKGTPIATCGIFTDLRERVRVEQRLAHAQERLALTEKQAVIAELAGTTAHELNQPLTSVSAYCELLLRRLPEGSPEHRAASIITEETSRMATIVRKIGRVTRYETTSYIGEQRILDLDRASTQSEPPPPISEPNE